MKQSPRQTIWKIAFLNPLANWLQTILSCWKLCLHPNADLDHFKMQNLQEMHATNLKSTSAGMLCVFQSHTFVQSAGVARNKQLFHTSCTEANYLIERRSLICVRAWSTKRCALHSNKCQDTEPLLHPKKVDRQCRLWLSERAKFLKTSNLCLLLNTMMS